VCVCVCVCVVGGSGVVYRLPATPVALACRFHDQGQQGQLCNDDDDDGHVCFFRLLLLSCMLVLYKVYRQLSRLIISLSGIIPD